MTYTYVELGVVKTPISKRLIKSDSQEYKGLVYTKFQRGKFKLIYEGLESNPFVMTGISAKLKEGYIATPLTALDFLVLRADLNEARNIEGVV